METTRRHDNYEPKWVLSFGQADRDIMSFVKKEIPMLDLTKIDSVHKVLPELEEGLGSRLPLRLKECASALELALKKGLDHWILTFSGGKDSTTTLIVALETILQGNLLIPRIDVIYSDTLIEIPVIREYALRFLNFLKGFDRVASLPLHCHVVQPALEERFWVCLLGKGYPPPHQRFRWCTRRLKIEPVEAALKSHVQPNRTVILTGIRFGESADRDRRLNHSCRRGGECGQGAWFQYSSRLQAAYLAPIVHWQECDVWDFLNYWAPQFGYPTHLLEKEVYNGRDTRFGCWMCTVVRQDRAMEKITSLSQWTYLRPLLEFRQRVKQMTSTGESRYKRPDGKVGRLSLDVRKQLLYDLMRLERKLQITLISREEVEYIQKLWEDPRYRGYLKGSSKRGVDDNDTSKRAD